MFANERHKKICKLLRENGSVITTRLAEHFAVSIETIRRDLLTLEQQNLLHRVHGGAVIPEEMQQFMSLSERLKINEDSKLELCRTACKFINEGDVIGVDCGSTAVSFAAALKENFSSLTIVTCCLDVFESLCRYKDFKVILCAGEFLKKENVFSGPLALEALSKLHMQKVFIFPAALSLRFGICDHRTETFVLQEQFLKSSENIFILADSSKFERTELLKLDDMRPSYTYITDRNLLSGLKNLYADNDITVVTGE